MYKMNEADAFFVHSSVARYFEDADTKLQFPIDELGCYLSIPFDPEQFVETTFPIAFTTEWMTEQNYYQSLERIWSNLTAICGNCMFSLDVLLYRE